MNNEIPNPTTFTQVLILGNYIDIQWIPARLMTEAYGESDHESREIRLRDNLRGLQALDTALHEMTHQISDLLKLDLTEAQVHGLGLAWANVFAANPNLIRYGVPLGAFVTAGHLVSILGSSKLEVKP